MAEVSTSLARPKLQAVRVSTTLATLMADHGKHRLRASGYLDRPRFSPIEEGMTELSVKGQKSGGSVWAAARADRLVRVTLVIKAALTAGAASYHSGGESYDEHNYNKYDCSCGESCSHLLENVARITESSFCDAIRGKCDSDF